MTLEGQNRITYFVLATAAFRIEIGGSALLGIELKMKNTEKHKVLWLLHVVLTTVSKEPDPIGGSVFSLMHL